MANNKDSYQEKSSTINDGLKAGALIGGGALAFTNRRFLGQQLSRLGNASANQAGRAYTSVAQNLLTSPRAGDTFGRYKRLAIATSDGLGKQTGVFSAARNIANPHKTQFSSRFDSSMEKQLKRKANKNLDPVHQNSTAASQYYFNDIHMRKNEMKKEAFAVVQHREIKKKIQSEMAEKHKNDLYQMLIDYEKKKGVQLFGAPNADKVIDFTQEFTGRNAAEKHNKLLAFDGEEEAQAFVAKLTGILSSHSSPKAAGMKNKKGEIDKVQENISAVAEDAFKRAFAPDAHQTVQAKLMARSGYKQLTFGAGKRFDMAGDEMRIPIAGGKHKRMNMITEIEKQYGGKMNLDEMILDPSVYVNDAGKTIDMRGHNKGIYSSLGLMQDAFQVPFLRFNFLDLAHFTTIRSVKEMPKMGFLRAGETHGFVQHNLKTFNQHLDKKNATAVFKPLESNGYMYAGGKLFDVAEGKLIDDGLYMGSVSFGPLGRMHNGMGNLREKEEAGRGFIKRLFDVGAQQSESFWSSTKGAVTKFSDPLYAPNLQNSIKLADNLPPEKRSAALKEYYGRMYGTMNSNAMQLSPESVNYMATSMNDGFKLAGMKIDVRDLHRDEEVMDALGEIVSKTKKAGNPTAFYSSKGNQEADGIVAQIHDSWGQYVNDPNGFLKSKDMEPDRSIALPDMIAPMQLHEPNLISATERAKRLVHQYALNQMEMGTEETQLARKLVERGKFEGILSNEDVRNVRQLDTLNGVRNFHNKVYSGNRVLEEEGLNEFAQEVLYNPQMANDVQLTAREFQPWYAAAAGETTGSVTGSNTTLYRKHTSYRQRLETINEEYKSQGKVNDSYAISKHGEAIWGTMRELFAGRKNASEVTTATAFPFYYAERLDNAVSGLGLGLSQTHRGSATSIIGNQFLRRVAMPYMAYQQGVWLDGQFGDIASDTLAETYVNMHQDVAAFKEFTGINAAVSPWTKVFAGADQVADLTMPPVKAFNFLTFGALSDWRSGEEVEKHYESGEDAVRKNRYWGIGSSAPWAGTGIDYFEANWYRRMKSDYKFTDTMYGSESEYWANNWMPTLTHPFAPIKHFFTDPYHYEDKHKEDRPYAVTGGFSEIQQIPIIGAALDGTVGRILKPRQENAGLQKAHRAYLSELNANIAAKYGELEDGHFVKRGVAGGVSLLEAPNVMQTGDSISSEDEQQISALLGDSDDDSGTGFASSSIASIGGNGGLQVSGTSGMATNGSSGNMIGMADLAQMDLTNRNNLLAAGGTGAPALNIDRYAQMLDPNIVVNPNDIGRVDSAGGMIRDAFYSASEIGGMYGFLSKTAIGFEESGRGVTWANSSQMTSYSRQFWDMGLGGMGGQISEIGRRYVPRDPNKEYYSPIKNTMPDWMPGTEYFTDFKHGDPYAKIKKGEMRLPGDAYETLYNLHGDGTGKGEWEDYGVFDRFRILADTAPYSENYKKSKAIVSQMNTAGLLSSDMQDEYQEIRDQVKARKQKYRWYNRRFLNADVKMETVKVTKILDQNTFLTKEHGNNPIRLAGVKLSQDDAEAVDWLSQFIKEGATLKIGVDGDPNSRINDDTMNTMSAVVYAPQGEKNGLGPSYSIRGQSLNYILANRKWSDGSKITTRDDEGSVATHALFANDMRFVGRQVERLTHDILPQLPILGVFADKFLQVRSPLESYERQQVYGKEWRPWTEPIKSWLRPMADTIASRNPLIAAAEGAGIGHLMTKSAYHGRGRIVGAAIGGAMATARVFYEQTDALIGNDSSTWLPERRQKEREINEYFDRLKYVKYKGLYEKAKALAKTKEGVDIEAFFNDSNAAGVKNKGLRKYIAEKKKWLSMAKKSGYGKDAAVDAQLEELAKSSSELEADKTLSHAGPYASLAMQFRKEYEGTLYGIDPKTSDMRDVLKAFTPKEREYFPEFMKANNAKERNRILELVPNDMKRVLQAKWGMDVDKKTDIKEYFGKHNLPSENWSGWGVNSSLDNIKVKVMKNEGVELTEAGFWADDEKRADNAGAQAIPLQSISSKMDVMRLEEVLRGAGLSDVKISMSVGQGNGKNHLSTMLNIVKDVHTDIQKEVNSNIHNILSG